MVEMHFSNLASLFLILFFRDDEDWRREMIYSPIYFSPSKRMNEWEKYRDARQGEKSVDEEGEEKLNDRIIFFPSSKPGYLEQEGLFFLPFVHFTCPAVVASAIMIADRIIIIYS